MKSHFVFYLFFFWGLRETSYIQNLIIQNLSFTNTIIFDLGTAIIFSFIIFFIVFVQLFNEKSVNLSKNYNYPQLTYILHLSTPETITILNFVFVIFYIHKQCCLVLFILYLRHDFSLNIMSLKLIRIVMGNYSSLILLGKYTTE